MGSMGLEPAWDYPACHHRSGSHGSIVSEQPKGRALAHPPKLIGEERFRIIAEAYLSFLHKWQRRQAVIDKLKRDCGIR